MKNSKKALLLVNLGTPDKPETKAVRRYLKQFLSDPYVIDIHPFARFLLLNLVILPRRPKQSAAAYRKIWTDRGSPLLFHGEDLRDGVAEELGDTWRVELAMRYGSPSIESAIEKLQAEEFSKIIVFPLFPQYAESSVQSAIDECKKYGDNLSFVEPFYEHPGFIEAIGEIAREHLKQAKTDHILFSFHGLPERHLKKLDESDSHCLIKRNCCDEIIACNRRCYRAQCYATAKAMANNIGIQSNKYTICFQSRLGRTPWIRPFTDEVLTDLAENGIKRVAVFCPAFVADCLETIEEIGIREKERFLAAGGEKLTLIPCVNSTHHWVKTVSEIAREHA